MNHFRHAIVLALTLALAACGKAEPRSKVYFDAHPDEAASVVSACQQGTVRSDECGNADQAAQEAKGRERFKRFLGK